MATLQRCDLFVSRAATNLPQALRFFQRAIDCYDDALKKFPESFDLAYNKWVTQMPWEMAADAWQGESSVRHHTTPQVTG